MTTLELYSKGAKVWIPHADKVWEGAELLEDYSPNKPTLELVSESNERKTLNIKSESDLPFLRNPPILIGENDLTALSYLHEPAVLHNLYVRFCQLKDIYTYCGIVLVAINPYDDLPIYGTDTIQTYRGQAMGDLDPHIFAVAEEAYTQLEREQMDQSIIVSGESGAGKTVSAKYAMRYFATVGGSTTETQIEKKVLASSPVMEAIGNAKTTRNDNSSRFGKFIEIQLNKQFHISGASMRTYLLEKSRVVFQAPEERNYHIFYQLCAARDNHPYLRLDDASKYHYLNQGNSFDDMNDRNSYTETVNALTMLGFSEAEQKELFKIIAAILHLGNVRFVETIIEQENEQNQEGCTISNMQETLKTLADLLEIDMEDLAVWLCTKKMVSMREVFMIPMSTYQAIAARDALAKHIYAQLFDWVVAVINKALESDVPKYKFIGVLDIYGFETFETNSFEQFCINYANEKLQQQFNLHVFKLEQEEYIKEEIEWKMIDFYDNQPCIDLIESKLGVLDLLDEECKMPKGSDRSWTEKLYNKCMKYSHFGKARFGTSAFIIEHFADKVQYESNGFLEKNRDTVIEEQISVLKSSKNTLVRKLFCEDHTRLAVQGGAKLRLVSAKPVQNIQKTHKKTVGSQFRDSLNMLMTTLNATTPHYVRCIKPNDTKTPFEYNPQRAVQQLRACGVLETIRISAAGFPSRWSYIDFFYRYRVLCKFKDIRKDNMRYTCTTILQQYIKNPDYYQFGKTKIFFRAGQVAYLEKLRADKLMRCCIIVQSTIRTFIWRRKYLRMQNAIYNIQRYARGYLARRRADNLRRNRAAVTIQRYFRGWTKRTQFKSLKYAVDGIQRYARGYLARIRYLQLLYNAKAIVIQKCVRGWLARLWYEKERHKVIICQAAIRRFLARRLYKKLRIEARSIEHVKTLNKGLENKIISLQQRMDELSKHNNELKKKEAELIDIRLKLTTFKSLEIEHKNLNNVLAQRDAKIAELENLLKNERDEKMDLVNEHDKYKQESEEQRNVWSEEMSKLRRELDNINEIVKNYEQHGEEDMNERIEHEKLLILNEQDNDRHAYQKLLQEYHCLEQHCEDLEQQIKDQNKQTHHHIRNVSDVSSISSIADTVITTSDLPEDHGYGSTRSTSSSQHPKIDSIDWENANANSTLVASAAMTNSEINHEKKEEELDIGLLLKLQHKLSEVEREKNRLQKRLDDLDTSPRTERADNAIKDSQRISELELYISTLKAHLYELQDGIEEGSGLLKLQEQNRMLHDEMERRSEEIVQLKSVLAKQTNNMKTLVGSRTRTGEYINEDGELALAYETQKTINKQLELELQDEMAKYKAHEKEYKLEIEKLREDNDRQQRLLADNLHVTPQSKGQAYMQHEITKLTKENLELQDKCDTAADVVRKLKRQIKLLVKKLRESGIDIDEAMNDLNTQDEGLHKHGRTPNIRKKERDYLGMFSFKAGDEPLLTKQLVIDLKPRTAVTLLPGLPAYVVFMCIRHTDFINDEDKVKALLSNFSICVKKVVKKRHEDFESVVLWLSNTLRLLHCMKQYSGDVAFQKKNTQRQNEQCLRNFDLSEYRQLLSDIAVWIYQVAVRNLEEKIQPLVVPAILEHEEIRGVTGGNKPAGFSRRASISARDLGSPIGNQKPTTALLQELTNHHKVLCFYGVDSEVISQVFKQIFYFICASSLNNLLLRKELCHWSKGFQIRHNLSHFEMWTREKNLDEKAIHNTLEPIIQASHLLQARKTDEDVSSVCEMCSLLTPLQICKILNLYTPVDEFEQRVPVSFIRKVQAKLQERPTSQDQQTLLMDIQYFYPVRFPFNPSVICLEDLEIPDTLKLHMLEKI